MFGLGWLFPSPEKQASKRLRGHIEAVWTLGSPKTFVGLARLKLRQGLTEGGVIHEEALGFDRHLPKVGALMLLAEVKARHGLSGDLSRDEADLLQEDDEYRAAKALYYEADRIVSEADFEALQEQTYENARAALLAMVDEPNVVHGRGVHPIDQLVSERAVESDRGWFSYCRSPHDLRAMFAPAKRR